MQTSPFLEITFPIPTIHLHFVGAKALHQSTYSLDFIVHPLAFKHSMIAIWYLSKTVVCWYLTIFSFFPITCVNSIRDIYSFFRDNFAFVLHMDARKYSESLLAKDMNPDIIQVQQGVVEWFQWFTWVFIILINQALQSSKWELLLSIHNFWYDVFVKLFACELHL